jgi:hypothetical protein
VLAAGVIVTVSGLVEDPDPGAIVGTPAVAVLIGLLPIPLGHFAMEHTSTPSSTHCVPYELFK